MSRPELATQRLRLEPLTLEHTEELVELDSDPLVLRHIFGRALTREEVLRDWMPKRTRPDAAERGIGYWVGLADGEFVGWWCLGIDDGDATTAELGYRLRRAAWGRGYAVEGARALLDHAFGTVGLSRVWAETMAVNVASRRVMEKLGMRLERSYVAQWEHPVEGWEEGEVVYTIDRESFLSGG